MSEAWTSLGFPQVFFSKYKSSVYDCEMCQEPRRVEKKGHDSKRPPPKFIEKQSSGDHFCFPLAQPINVNSEIEATIKIFFSF